MLTVTISQGHCCPLMYLLVPNRQIEPIELNKIFYILITIFLVIDTEYIFMILAKDWQIPPLCILVSVKYMCVCMCVYANSNAQISFVFHDIRALFRISDYYPGRLSALTC